jgi:hypothetical protein
MNGKLPLCAAAAIAIASCTTLAFAATASSTATPAAPAVDSAAVSGLGARNIGAAVMSGRISAVAARQEQDGKVTIYVGAASGGVWKSLDGGTTFKPVFDKQPVQSIGAIALDPSDPNTVWVGTGESWVRNSVSVGNGVYRSTDAGESWDYLGLPESERVNRIIVHPDRQQYRVRLRTGQAVVGFGGSRPVQDDGRGQDLEPGPQGRESLDRVFGPHHGSEESAASVRGAVGFPAQGLDFPLRRRRTDSVLRLGPVRNRRRRRELAAARRQDGEGTSCAAMGSPRRYRRTVECRHRLCIDRRDALGALPVQ